MAISAAMTNDVDGKDVDGHENDLVMPGFRFHPTEEELIDFYLRRKVEGKPFNVELITFLDLYRYDPWELPALAAIGEKEWFFYVPRDRKYRNGDRPNRVTTSGYWKATGADRMIRNESFRSIGLKKTLVFYTGKAPKGVRTGWIMNEYRLPQSETDLYHKAEISLCRVYKRADVDDHRRPPHLKSSPFPNSAKQPSSSFAKLQESLSTDMNKIEQGHAMICSNLYPTANSRPILPRPPPAMTTAGDELHRLVGYDNQSFMQQSVQVQNQNLHPSHYQLQSGFKAVPVSLTTISEKLLEWNAHHYATRDQDNNFN